MERAAKKKDSLAMVVIASMIVWVSACLLSSAASASSATPTLTTTAPTATHVALKSRAEVFLGVSLKNVERSELSPVNATRYYDVLEGVVLECLVAPSRTVTASADDVATLKSIRRHVERLAQGKVVSSDANTMMQVRSLQRHIANENYASAGTRFHSLNFKFAREAQSRGGLRGLNIDRSIPTPGGFRPSRRPDYRFDSGSIFDLKPTRSSANAYDTTQQFQDIFGATGNMPIPLYYRLWVTP